MKEIIDKLNDLKILQKSIEFTEDLPKDIYDKYFQDEIKSGLDINKHRWYETTLSVYQIEQGFIGVISITDLFSESGAAVEDCYHTLQFYEVEEELITSYKIIK